MARKKAKSGVKIDPPKKGGEGPIQFLNSYYQSDMFKKRSGASAKQNTEYFTKQTKALKGFRKMNDDEGSRYDPFNQQIILSSKQAKDIKADLHNSVLPHEYAHSVRKLNFYDEGQFATRHSDSNALEFYNNVGKNPQIIGSYEEPLLSIALNRTNMDTHKYAPNENYSDLTSLRWLMRKHGVYDTRKKDLDLPTLQKALEIPEIKNDFIIKRLLKNYKPEKIVELNNEVATVSDNTESTTIPTAKAGGTVPKKLDQLTNFSNYNDMPKAKSGIHIKPENKGKFNATKKRTGKTTEELTHSKNPVTRKRAIFAQNAAKWHKGEGGLTLADQEIDQQFRDENDPRLQLMRMPKGMDAQGQYMDQMFQSENVQKGRMASVLSNPNTLPTAKYMNPTAPSTQDLQRIDGSFSVPKTTGKQKNKMDLVGMGLATLPALANTLFPEKANRKYIRPEDTPYYNPYPQGTGSQAIMKKGGMVVSGTGIKFPEGGEIDPITGKPKKKPVMMSATYRDPNWAAQAQTPEATRAQDAMVVDPLTAQLTEAQAHQQRKQQHFMQMNPNLNVQQYAAQQQQAQGYFNKDGDWIPNANYRKPGRYINPDIVSTDIAVQNIQKQFRTGGQLRQNSEYEVGGEMALYDDRTGAQPISDNPYSSQMVEFKGPSHEEGGIPMSYTGKKVEVEGEETAFKDAQGNLQILGNMKNPLTGRLFKNDGKMIAKEERKATNQMDRGNQLVAKSDPNDPFERLTFNSGKAKMQGADAKMQKLATIREAMATVQQQKLELADKLGIKPLDLDKAKYGKMIKAYNGEDITPLQKQLRQNYEAEQNAYVAKKKLGDPKPSLSDRNNNPGNIKITKTNRAWLEKYGAVQADAATDGGYFAKFPDREKGRQAMMELLTKRGPGKGYKEMTVEDAIHTWTGGKPYQMDLGILKGKKVGKLSGEELDGLVKYITKGEGTAYGPSVPKPSSKKQVAPPARASLPPIDTIDAPSGVIANPNIDMGQLKGLPKFQYDVPAETPVQPVQAPPVTMRAYQQGDLSSDAEGLNPAALAGEAYTLLTERVDPVLMQKYRPELEQPFQYSFQDQISAVDDTYRSALGYNTRNPQAQAALAAQAAQQKRGILGEEFRVNQGESARVYNQNRQTMNDAQLRNLQLADQQYVRQSQARSNTKQNRFNALSSISEKYLHNQMEQNQLKVYENLYKYRFNEQDDYQVKYEGAQQQFNIPTVAPNTGITPNTAVSNTRSNRMLPLSPKSIANSVGMMGDASLSPILQRRNMTQSIGNANDILREDYTKRNIRDLGIRKAGGSITREFKSFK